MASNAMLILGNFVASHHGFRRMHPVTSCQPSLQAGHAAIFLLSAHGSMQSNAMLILGNFVASHHGFRRMHPVTSCQPSLQAGHAAIFLLSAHGSMQTRLFFRSLCSVFGTSLFSISNTCSIQCSSDNVVSCTW